MVYFVKYELNKPGKNYASLYAALEKYDYIRDNGLHSAWFISTSWTAAQVYEHLRHHFDINDRIFVTQIRAGEHQGWLHQNIWSWVNARL